MIRTCGITVFLGALAALLLTCSGGGDLAGGTGVGNPGGMVSIDHSRNEDAGLAEVIRDERVAAPEEGALKSDLGGVVRRCLEKLPMRLKKIMRLRFGIDCPRPHTLGEIGTIMGVSSERIRQLQEEALESLRKGDCAGTLAELAVG